MKKTITIIASAAGTLLLLVILWAAFQWFFCRFYVPAGYMAIVTAKSGRPPQAGTILVERGEKGIWREVLAEGRHFLNPVTYDVRIMPAVTIPLGKVGIVTAKVGKELPPGEIIAADTSGKGVWRDVLGPGTYRLNPEGYKVEITDAMSIPIGYIGIVTSQTGKRTEQGKFAVRGEQGVFKDILHPGLYYINRYAHRVNIFEIGMNQVTMSDGEDGSVVTGRNRVAALNTAMVELEQKALDQQNKLRRESIAKPETASGRNMLHRVPKAKKALHRSRKSSVPRDMAMAPAAVAEAKAQEQIFGVSRAVEFPSRDGFKITLDMTVEFELMPEHVARIYLLYGDLPQVVEKIILPQVLSSSRLRGSSYRAQDFIMGEGREIFQRDLQDELAKTLAAKNIIVHNAIIRHVDIPLNILTPIRAVSIAREQNLTNQSLQETAKKLAELNIETELIEQKRREVGQETEKMAAEIAARRNREVAGIKAETALAVANLELKRSAIIARTKTLQGETAVQARYLVENETARGRKMVSDALGGGDILLRLQAVEALNPGIKTRVIYAGEGTLWTDLKGGSLALPVKAAVPAGAAK